MKIHPQLKYRVEPTPLIYWIETIGMMVGSIILYASWIYAIIGLYQFSRFWSGLLMLGIVVLVGRKLKTWRRNRRANPEIRKVLYDHPLWQKANRR